MLMSGHKHINMFFCGGRAKQVSAGFSGSHALTIPDNIQKGCVNLNMIKKWKRHTLAVAHLN